MKDWKQMAAAGGLDIPAEELARVAGALDGLEAAFRPLTRAIPEETEPAVTFRVGEEEA
jgi:hypothetical protein